MLAALERGERIPGIGRPVLRGDERVPPMLEAIRRHGRGEGRCVSLALEIDQVLASKNALQVNSAGLCGAVMRDIGFSPEAAAAFCLIYFLVPVLAHARVTGVHRRRNSLENRLPKLGHDSARRRKKRAWSSRLNAGLFSCFVGVPLRGRR